MNDLIFELEDAHFSYLGRFPALCGVDIKIRKGDKVSLLGPNGSGKSTLLQILDGLIFSDKGLVKIWGKELKESLLDDKDFCHFFRSKVGFVFQNPDIQLFSPTVEEDIVFGPLQLGVDKEEVKNRLRELEKKLNISHLLKRAPYQLSMGEKRLAALASVLAIKPEVIILDEPTAGLDPLTSWCIANIINQENFRGVTIITATHDLHLVAEISDIVYVLSNDKKIARSGFPKDILTDDEFLHQHNLIHIHSHRHKDGVHIHKHTHIGHHADYIEGLNRHV